MQVFRLLLAVLARVVDRDVLHRAGPVERDQRDDVLEAVGLHADQRLAHALAFQLEHADRLAARQHLVGRRVVQRQRARSTSMPRRFSSSTAVAARSAS